MARLHRAKRRNGLLAGLLMTFLAAAGVPAAAQDGQPPFVGFPILTLDQERLYAESEAAARIIDEIEQRASELASENRAIEAELTAEELDLTEKRETLAPEEFRRLADAFDEKVQRIRAEQDGKERDLQTMRDEERQLFLRRITPILAEVARERGALMILDRRTVLLSAETVDITEAAIARIDAVLLDADGNLTEPLPASPVERPADLLNPPQPEDEPEAEPEPVSPDAPAAPEDETPADGN